MLKHILLLASIALITSSYWDGTLSATHFWDCNGAACDATTLQPWDPNKYRYAP